MYQILKAGDRVIVKNSDYSKSAIGRMATVIESTRSTLRITFGDADKNGNYIYGDFVRDGKDMLVLHEDDGCSFEVCRENKSNW